MLGHLSIAAISAVMLASSVQSTPEASVGAVNPYPVSNYTCEDGTHLEVRLLGDRASVSVNGATAVDLPSMGSEGTTFSNGRQSLSIVQGHRWPSHAVRLHRRLSDSSRGTARCPNYMRMSAARWRPSPTEAR